MEEPDPEASPRRTGCETDALKIVLKSGLAKEIELKKTTSVLEDPDRNLIVLASNVGIMKPQLGDIERYMSLMEALTMSQITNVYPSHLRAALLEIDEECHYCISKSPNAAWRFGWAKNESVKCSALWGFALRAVKREGGSRSSHISHLRELFYPVSHYRSGL